MQLCSLALLLAVSSSQVASTSSRSRASSPLSHAEKTDKEKFVYWGPQNFLGLLPARSRRSEMDNRISTFLAPPASPAESYGGYGDELSSEATAAGQSVMEEFLMFLTLKDTGLLDMCMNFKRR